jgi:hypothetical protein
MFLARILRGIRRFLGFDRTPVSTTLRTLNETREILQRECQRADRARSELAILVFTPTAAKDAEALFAALVVILRQRLRTTDEVGWLASNVLAAILPHTGLEGARTLRREVCAALSADLPPPRCAIYVYPTRVGEGDGDLTAQIGILNEQAALPQRSPP